MDCSTPGLPVHHQCPEFTQTHVHWVSDAIQPSHPLSSPSPAFNLSQHQDLFNWVSSSHQVAEVLEFQLQHQTFQWTFRTDFLKDGLVGSPCCPRDSQESSPTPRSKASILRCSAFFIVQLSHPYMTTGKTITLTRWTFVGKVMSLLFNMLSRLVTTFLPRSKCLLISCDQQLYQIKKNFNGLMKDSTGIRKWHLFRDSCIPSGFLLVPSQFLSLLHLYRETKNHFVRQCVSSHILAPRGFFFNFFFSINCFLRESYSELTYVDIVNADFSQYLSLV